MRVLGKNKNKIVKYCNVTNDEQTDSYGTPILVYGDIETLWLSVMPLDNVVESTNYGVDFSTSSRTTLDIEECALFEERTRIWIDKTPNANKDNYNYVVKIAPIKTLNSGVMIISKRAGA